MGNKRERALEFGKSALIALLTLSALFLVGRTQAYTDVTPSPAPRWLQALAGLLAPDGETEPGSPVNRPVTPVQPSPVRLMVRNGKGCYGAQYDTQAVDADFELRLGPLLGEALAGAGAGVEVSEEVWRQAMGDTAPAVYYDFLGDVPLGSLSVWLGGERNRMLTGFARRLLLTEGADGAPLLLYQSAEGTCYAGAVEESIGVRLTGAVEGYTPNNAVFALQQAERYPALGPYVMLLPDTPAPALFSAMNPIALEGGVPTVQDQLLRALLFHPQASTVYQAVDGMVVKEGADTLRINADGTVVFAASDAFEPRYSVPAAANLEELVEITYALAEQSIGAWCGGGRVYYMGAEALEGGATALYFGYALEGAAVQLYEDGYAARFVVREGYISDATLHFRAYQMTGADALLLPELLAAAAMEALDLGGGALTLFYQDSGQGDVPVVWGAEGSK